MPSKCPLKAFLPSRVRELQLSRQGIILGEVVIGIPGAGDWLVAGLRVRRELLLLLLLLLLRMLLLRRGDGALQELAGLGRGEGRGEARLVLGRLGGGVSPVGAPAVLLLLVLHAPILEPDLYLALRQLEGVGHLNALGPTKVAAIVELLLELDQLDRRVGGARPLAAGFPLIGYCATRRKDGEISQQS
jgi:hypothetical protein